MSFVSQYQLSFSHLFTKCFDFLNNLQLSTVHILLFRIAACRSLQLRQVGPGQGPQDPQGPQLEGVAPDWRQKRATAAIILQIEVIVQLCTERVDFGFFSLLMRRIFWWRFRLGVWRALSSLGLLWSLLLL